MNEPVGLWIRLTIAGVTRPGFGCGKNAREAISDAIRNAAMRFGVALDLWAKEDLHVSPGEPNDGTNHKGAPQSPPVSQAAVGNGEPASPGESFAERAARAQASGPKATKTQLAKINELVDVCAAARGTGSDQVLAALKNDGYDLDDIRKAKADELIGKLTKWSERLVPA